MGAVFVLAGLAVGAVMLTLVAVGLLVKTIVRLVLLPLLLIKWVIMGIVLLVVGPVVFLVGLLAFTAFALVLSVPLLPLVAVGALVWLLVRSNRPAVA